jgi:hypothetical protein
VTGLTRNLGREIAHKFNTWWEVGTVRCLEKNGEFAVFDASDQQLYKHEPNKADYGVHK